jgi:beta-galactosidase GanA
MDEKIKKGFEAVSQKMMEHSQDMQGVQRLQRNTGRRIMAAMDAQIETPKKLESIKQEVASKQKREDEHTLWRYWCLANWGERFGMVSFLFGVFCVGCGAAQIPWLAHLISLVRSL